MRNDWLETNIKATEELLFLLYKQRESKLQQRLTVCHAGQAQAKHLRATVLSRENQNQPGAHCQETRAVETS